MKRRGAGLLTLAAALALAASMLAAQPRAPGGDAAAAAERAVKTIADHRAAIRQAELRHGPWGAGLTERYGDLAEVLWASGAFRESLATWNRTLQLQRIAEGPHTLDQVVTARRIANNHLRLSDWTAADRMEDYIWRLHRRPEVDAERQFAAGMYRMRWQLAYLHYSPHPGSTLGKALWLLQTMERGIGPQLSLAQRRMLVRGQASVHYHLARAWQQLVNDALAKPEAFYNPDTSRGAGQPRWAMDRSAARGEALLAGLLADYPADDPAQWRERCLALLALADWQLAFARRQTAQLTYRRAIEAAAAQDGGAALLRQQLSGPRPILPPLAALPRPNDARVLARFDVSAQGRVKNVALLDYAPVRLSKARLSRHLRAMHFRPQFVDGAAVATAGFTWRHALDSQSLR